MDLHEILDVNKHQIITPNKFITISEFQRKNQLVLPSGSRNFDEILGGGFYSGKKYLIYGANKTGKTQLCHQLCIQAYKNLIKPSTEKNSKFIFYFDTENTFRPERIEELVSSTELKLNKILKRILVSKIMSNSALLLALKDSESIFAKNYGSILVIDSINNFFRSDIGDKNVPFNTATETFLNILRKLDNLTSKFNLFTIVSAQITSSFSKQAPFREIPMGNQFLNHFFSEYIYLTISDKGNYFTHLANSLKMPEKKLPYVITLNGIQDYRI
jgi:RecA/RadA recombinase